MAFRSPSAKSLFHENGLRTPLLVTFKWWVIALCCNRKIILICAQSHLLYIYTWPFLNRSHIFLAYFLFTESQLCFWVLAIISCSLWVVRYCLFWHEKYKHLQPMLQFSSTAVIFSLVIGEFYLFLSCKFYLSLSSHTCQ